MKRVDLILIAIAVLSILMHVLNVTGSIIFITLSILSVSFLYFYLGAFLFNGIPLKGIFKKSSYSGISVFRILGSAFLGLAIAIMLLGLLFKLNYWPGGHVMLLSGINFLILSMLVMLIKLIMSKDSFYKKYLIKSVVLLVVAIGFYFLPFGYIEGIKYRNNPEILALIEEMKLDINNQALWKQYYELINKGMAK